MNCQNAKEYLLSIPKWTKQKNSFEEIRLMLERLNCTEENFSVIHVAGTNGKGSVCAFLTSMLTEGGYRTGTFTSPHLTDIRERFLIDGRMVSSELFEKSFSMVYHAVKEAEGSPYQHPSFFEFLFLMGMVIFKESRVEYIVLETGLGGRLDTTNVIQKPLAAVITSVSMDHMEYLGNTLQSIAAEKAGIIKPLVPVVYDAGTKEVSDVIEERAGELSAALWAVKEERLAIMRNEDSSLTVSNEGIVYKIPFAGRYQAVNAILAVTAIKAAGITLNDKQMQDGIEKTRWPGRMEEVLPGVYLDGAHNAGGIKAFIETARELAGNKKLYLLFASVSDKEYEIMIEGLCKALAWSEVATARISGARGLDSDTMERLFLKYASCPVTGFGTVKEATAYILGRKRQDELIFCAGSLYLIGEIKSELRRRYHD